MVMMRCLPQEIHRHLAFHGKSSTLRELMESLEFYEQQSKALDFSRDSHKGNPVGYDRPPKGSPKGGKDRTPKGEGKGKEIRCRRCGKPGHVEKDCWSKSPKRTDATDPHFLVDSGASIHLISQSLVDEGYLRICQEWTVNERLHHSQRTGNDPRSMCRSRVQHVCSQK